MIYIVSTIAVIGILVFVHELGHFLAAKSVGIRVDTFSLGFPPKMIGKTIGDTEYKIGWIPLGGYVKMAGMIDESFDTEFEESEAQPWEYRSKTALEKVFVSSAGVIMNLLLAVLIFIVLTLSSGITSVAGEPVVNSLGEGLPAQAAGLQVGDLITAIDGRDIATWEEMTTAIFAKPNEEITLSYKRDAVENTITLKTISQKTVVKGSIMTVGMIGIGGKTVTEDAGFFESVEHGVLTTYYWLKLTVSSMALLVTGEESMKNIGGPIMIAQLAGESAKSGLASLFSFIAIISINLGFINILPIPALDGGHIIVALFEGVSRKQIATKTKLIIQQIGTAILLTLIVVVIFNDITRLFN